MIFAGVCTKHACSLTSGVYGVPQCFIHVYCKIMCLQSGSGLGHIVIPIFPLIVKSLKMNHIYWCESSLVGMAD